MVKFELFQPLDLPEALQRAQEYDDFKFFAGGTDLLVEMNARQSSPSYLIDIGDLSELKGIAKDDKGDLHIGAGVTISQIAENPLIQKHAPALNQAAGKLGSWQVRNTATLGGNLCNAAPSAETAPPLLVMDAIAVVVDLKGEKQVPIEEFWLGPGKTILGKGALLKEVIIPAAALNSDSLYLRQVIRKSIDISLVNMAARLQLDKNNEVKLFHLALGAVAPTPIRIYAAESMVEGKQIKDVNIDEIARIAANESKPIDDIRASAWYRRSLAEVLVQRGLKALGFSSGRCS